jgi:5S rRNA maturation endonuclease (ribonuclease M5)
MNIDPTTTKYLVKAQLQADGVVEKADVVGAIFGQTEGLLGDDLDLRDLQKSGRIGRIEVEVNQSKGRSEGMVYVPSSLDQVETTILAAALETIDRVGPCRARLSVQSVEDVRVAKRNKIVDRARELYGGMMDGSKNISGNLTDMVRQAVQVSEVILFGPEKLPAGPNVPTSDAIIVVEGRSDVLNLLKYGIKNAIAVEGTNVPQTIKEMSVDKTITLFTDGDRGGELILKEMLQVAEVDFITRAPKNHEVEELSEKQIMKCLKNKMPVDQFIDMYGAELGIKKEARAAAGGGGGPGAGGGGGASGGGGGGPPRHDGARPPQRAEVSGGEAARLRQVIGELEGKPMVRFLDGGLNLVGESPIAEMIDRIRGTEGISTIVFDGVISQRLLDVARERGVRRIVGSTVGNVAKYPAEVSILLRSDLAG